VIPDWETGHSGFLALVNRAGSHLVRVTIHTQPPVKVRQSNGGSSVAQIGLATKNGKRASGKLLELDSEVTMRRLIVWVIEFIKLLARRRLYPLNAECPICHQMVRLHYNRAGRRHLLAHAGVCSRALYEGSRYCAHYIAKAKCLGSGTLAKFDPHPNENQHFKWPKFLDSDRP
jgi:hypothetical protein